MCPSTADRIGNGGSDVTEDGFLGGRVRLRQPRAGFRSGIDAVLLAAAVPARPGQAVLELGCGAGAASLCLGARVPGLALTGLELVEPYAALAAENAAANRIALEVLTGTVAAPPAGLKRRRFDHVLANPPYFRADAHALAADPGRAGARAEAVPLACWVDAGIRRLAPGGTLTLIQRAERLPELLAALGPRMGATEVLPLQPRAGRSARLVLLRSRKGRRSPFRLLPPLVLHAGAAHDGDRDSYAPAVAAVLRAGAALPWPEAGGSGGA